MLSRMTFFVINDGIISCEGRDLFITIKFASFIDNNGYPLSNAGPISISFGMIPLFTKFNIPRLCN